jgi:hypothetical protein
VTTQEHELLLMLIGRYKRDKFEPDRTQRDLIDVFSIQKSPPLLLPALKRQFWYRRPLSNIFSEALRLSGGHFVSSLKHVFAIASLYTAAAERGILTVNMSQCSGAIYLPLVHRATKMPVVVVNTHIACNVVSALCVYVMQFSLP